MEIIFATHNQHKAKEIQKLAGNSIKILTLNDIGIYDEIPEHGDTLMQNALEKAQYVYKKTNKPVFADDTGLMVDALDGRPGVFSARYAGEPKNDKKNLQKLLKEMEGKTNRSARFKTVIAFLSKTGTEYFEGIAEGSIIQDPRGYEGFGYDPAFVPEGYEKTFAEMPLNLKNELSHRSKAFRKFLSNLDQI